MSKNTEWWFLWILGLAWFIFAMAGDKDHYQMRLIITNVCLVGTFVINGVTRELNKRN